MRNPYVGKTYVRKYGKGQATIKDYFEKWFYDVPPRYEDQLRDFFVIVEEGKERVVRCSTFLSDYVQIKDEQ